MKSVNKIHKHLMYLEQVIHEHQVKNDSVSERSVGWQIDHSIKAINNIITYLRTAPTDKRQKINVHGLLFLWINYIPRGLGKAPKAVLPPEHITEKDLLDQLKMAKDNLSSLDTIDPKVTFKHLYFGILGLKKTMRFIEVHTNHHVKIVRDILK